ncbi:MAG: recombination regulator RecX [Gracilibacteraceae bacterium]|jgi:regulatory protein|nr:recombination regulator RecX [Gracilibacteraceae bacterium]
MRNDRIKKNGGDPLAAALRFLSRRAHTGSELTEKLRKRGFGAEETEAVVARLLECRYIDDEAYARRYCRLWRERRSRLRIQCEIRKRGVEEDIIAAALAEEYPPEREVLNCRRALAEKEGPAAEKTAASLYRQGYSAGHIRQALNYCG